MADDRARALKAFDALCADVEQFDDHPFIEKGSELFSNRVPLWMKSYLVNWLRNFARDHGQTVRAALADDMAKAPERSESDGGDDGEEAIEMTVEAIAEIDLLWVEHGRRPYNESDRPRGSPCPTCNVPVVKVSIGPGLTLWRCYGCWHEAETK